MTNMTLKKCWQCKCSKGHEEFHLDKSKACGRASLCKVCIKKRDAKRRDGGYQGGELKATHPALVKYLTKVKIPQPEPLPAGKVCTKCNKLRILEKYQIDRKGKYGRKSACKECSAKKDKRLAQSKAMKSANSKSILGGVRELLNFGPRVSRA